MVRRLFSAINGRFFAKSPFFVVFHVTARCNARCPFCFNWKNVTSWKTRSELSLDEIEKITKRIGSVYQLTIGGGEPFLRDDLSSILGLFHKNAGVQTVTIPSNGLPTARIARTLETALQENPGLHIRFGLSIPDIGSNLDDIFEVKGSQEKQKQTITEIQLLMAEYDNLTFSCGVVYNGFNAGRVNEILHYIKDNVKGCKPQIAVVRGDPEDHKALDISIPELQEVYKLRDALFPESDNRPFGSVIATMDRMVQDMNLNEVTTNQAQLECKNGEKMVVIYDNGDVYPCEYLDMKMGNIREHGYRLSSVLATETSQRIVKFIRDTKCHCTWECSMYNNILFSPKHMAKLATRHASRVTSSLTS